MKDIDINDFILAREYSEDYVHPKYNVAMRELIEEGKIKEVIPTIEIPLEEHIANKMSEQYNMGYMVAVDTILNKMVAIAKEVGGKAKK